MKTIQAKKRLAAILAVLLAVLVPLGAMAVQNVSTYGELVAAATAINNGTATDTVINIMNDIIFANNEGAVTFSESVTITADTDSDGNPQYTLSGDTGRTGRLITVGSAGNASNLTLSNLTLTGGYAEFDGTDSQTGDGGAVYVSGDAEITNCVFEGNTADYGGAVYVSGDAEITGSAFVDNEATYDGGAVFVGDDATIKDSVFEDNTAGGDGGAVWADTAEITGSAFVDNEATYDGGAVFAGRTAEITGSTFEDNTAGGDGGAVWAYGDATIDGSTFEGNTAGDHGGAVYIKNLGGTGSSAIQNSDFYGNQSGGNGGSIYSRDDLTFDGANYFNGNGKTGGGDNGNAPQDREGLGIYMDGVAALSGDETILDGVRPEDPDPTPQAKSGGSVGGPVGWYGSGTIGNCEAWVYLRSGPGTGYSAEGRIPVGAAITLVEGCRGDGIGWVKIIYGNTVYYVHENFILVD